MGLFYYQSTSFELILNYVNLKETQTIENLDGLLRKCFYKKLI